ncbi:MAG: ribonuclease R [Caedibacter sp. 38-128]|nr:ribonuclease R [Holosporales bacterium]OJX07232.1 MAG: ribonuclease R [Caedibacter sp. 38-128]
MAHTPQKFPSSEDILGFINSHEGEIRRREIAQAFHIKGNDRIVLKKMLKELVEKQAIQQRGKYYQRKGQLNLLVVKITGVDEEGYLLGAPEIWPEHEEKPLIRVFSKANKINQLNPEDLALVRLKDPKALEAEFVRKFDEKAHRVMGVFELDGEGGRLILPEKRRKIEYIIPAGQTFNAQHNDLVEAEWIQGRRGESLKVTKILGSLNAPKSISLIAIHTYELPHEFSPQSIELAEKAKVPPLGNREDLRDIPLVTIDDEDARDFDDAIWASPDTDPKNPKGWHLIVAIADVSAYVTPKDALDQEAYRRGNSVYFPDRVVPMLPEALSNNICSLKPQEDRACLAVHLWINQSGRLLRHKFSRALMRSAARLTYTKTQAAFEGQKTDLSKDFIKTVISPLYGAYKSLCVERDKRGPLDLDMPEERIYLDEKGQVAKIAPRPRLNSHRLIEEFMILANVAAAIELETRQHLCMYRVHDEPSLEKVDALREFLKGFDLSLPKGQAIRPKIFNHILEKAKESPAQGAINQLVLRAQAQAVYSPENIGHFGLNLPRYCHFTSPIRRYADLVVHRALVEVMTNNKDTPFSYTLPQLKAVAEHISLTERVAATAERETTERYVAAYLKDKIGESFMARINGVTEFAMFVTIEENGADGIMPLRLLADDYYAYDQKKQRVVGRRKKRIYTLGDRLKVTLHEAEPLLGGLTFLPAETQKKAMISSRKKRWK